MLIHTGAPGFSEFLRTPVPEVTTAVSSFKPAAGKRDRRRRMSSLPPSMVAATAPKMRLQPQNMAAVTSEGLSRPITCTLLRPMSKATRRKADTLRGVYQSTSQLKVADITDLPGRKPVVSTPRATVTSRKALELASIKCRARVGISDCKVSGGHVPKQSTASTRRQDTGDAQSSPVAQALGRRHTPPNCAFKAVPTQNLSVFNRLPRPHRHSLARLRHRTRALGQNHVPVELRSALHSY